MNADIIFFIGRLLLGGFMLQNAYNHFGNMASLVGYAESKQVPMAKWAVIVSGLLLVFGGYTLIAGVRIGMGIAALVLFFLPVTFVMHAFWKEEGPARMNDRIQFMKNLAILGALLMILSIPTPWPMSLG